MPLDSFLKMSVLWFLLTVFIHVLVCVYGDWENYREDHTGREIQCTKEEKLCLTHGRLIKENSSACFSVGSSRGCWEGTFFVDRRSLVEQGKYAGKCVTQSPCYWNQLKTEDGSCVHIDDFCNPKETLQRNIFGEPYCACASCVEPIVEIDQPEAEGVCRVPDFRRSIRDLLYSLEEKEVPCSLDELLCFLDFRVFWPKNGLCYELHNTEPCEEGQWLVLDEEEYFNGTGKLSPVCRPRPCAPGFFYLDFDGKCHEENEIRDVWCSGRSFESNIFGRTKCGVLGSSTFPSYRYGGGICVWARSGAGAAAQVNSHSACPTSNSGYCPRPVTRPRPGNPFFRK